LYGPIAVGLGLGLASRWISLFGAWAASQPVQRQRILADRLASERLFQRAKLAKARELEQTVLEETLIDRAKRDQEIERIDDVDRREQVRSQIVSTRNDNEERERLRQELEEAEETRDQAILYLRQRENELTNRLSMSESALSEAREDLRDARAEAEEIFKHMDKKYKLSSIHTKKDLFSALAHQLTVSLWEYYRLMGRTLSCPWLPFLACAASVAMGSKPIFAYQNHHFAGH
jgi:hypothetical protein